MHFQFGECDLNFSKFPFIAVDQLLITSLCSQVAPLYKVSLHVFLHYVKNTVDDVSSYVTTAFRCT
jgi:hypothetical protein